MGSYAEHEPVVVERAEGRYLIGVDGRRYLDAISSLWVTTLGHRVPELDAALVDQIGRVAHSTMLGHGNRIVVELAEALAEVVPVEGPHMLFASDGASAVEQALKIALQHSANLGDDRRRRFLALGGAYHGDTIGALSLGDGGFGAGVFDSLRFDVLRTPGYDDPLWAQTAVDAIETHGPELAAVVVEPLVQAAGGMRIAGAEAMMALGQAARRAGTLLICDEVATGFGRTGTMFASQQCGLRPDLLCLGKGLTGGYLPMSATVVSQEVFDSFVGRDAKLTLFHGHSYGGNALAAAIALRHLQLFEDWDVLANVKDRSEELARRLDDEVAPLRWVDEVRLWGLMAGVSLAGPWGRQVCDEAVRRGVLLRPLGDVVVVMPPLTVTSDEIALITKTLADSITEASANG